MNIFALHSDPVQTAAWHVDDHVNKMIIESAQMLSTAHRMLDGAATEITIDKPELGLKRIRFIKLLPGEMASFKVTDSNIQKNIFESIDNVRWYAALDISNKVCCMHTHENHPCNIWVRQTASNYNWLYELYKALANEFERRRGKQHAAWLNWHEFLKNTPKNIPAGKQTEFAIAMPEKYHLLYNDSVIDAYHRFYVGDKYRFARWSTREIPDWYQNLIPAIFQDDEHADRIKYLSDPKKAAKTWITLSMIK